MSPQFLVSFDDKKHSRLTPELLKNWAKEASSSLTLKVMMGKVDKTMDAKLIALVGLMNEAEVELVK